MVMITIKIMVVVVVVVVWRGGLGRVSQSHAEMVLSWMAPSNLV